MTRRSRKTLADTVSPPTPESFRAHAREEFAFLARDFGFQEEPIPTREAPLNDVAIWYVSPTTRIVIEGINWGRNARVALGNAGSVRSFENYDLGDLLAVRRRITAAGGLPAGGQVEQLRAYANLLREVGSDVLRGDHAVFPELAACVERRRAEYAAGRYPRG